MHKVKNLKKFDRDLSKYKQAVAKIKNKKLKTEYERYLQSFIHYCDLIDTNHDTIYGNGMINPAILKDNIHKMIEIRSKLESLVKQSN